MYIAELPANKGIVAGPQLVTPLFDEILLQDTSGALRNVITIIVADFNVTYYNPTPTTFVKDAPSGLVATTFRVGSTLGQIAATTTVSFTGLSLAGSPVGVGKTRRFIDITNEDPTNPIEVWDNNATPANAVGCTVYAGKTDRFVTSGIVKIRNPNGAPISVIVLETFYL